MAAGINLIYQNSNWSHTSFANHDDSSNQTIATKDRAPPSLNMTVSAHSVIREPCGE